MTLREILLSLSGKEVSTTKLQELSKQAFDAKDKQVHEKLSKVVQLARSKKINRFIFKIEGAFKKLLGQKKASGKIIDFNSKDLGEIETYSYSEAEALGIVDGLGKLANKDIYKTINSEILEYLKSDQLVWRKPWTDGIRIKGQTVGSQNYETMRPYHGVNAYLIWLRNMANKTNYKYFLTEKQIKNRGGSLKKDAKGIYVVAFVRSEKEEQHPENPELTRIEVKQGMVYYKIYPIEATTNVKEIKRKAVKEDLSEDQVIVSAQNIIDNMPKKPIIKTGGNSAFYSPSGDYVQMPVKKAFKNLNAYYSTLFHELVHSTGHEKRIDRKFKPGTKFGDKDYAFEELVAELGAAYLCGLSNIEYFTLKNSAAYLKGWASKLRSEMAQDKTFFFRAVLAATKAAKYISANQIIEKPKKDKANAKVNVKTNVKNAKKTTVKPIVKSENKPVEKTKSAQLPLFGSKKKAEVKKAEVKKSLNGIMSISETAGTNFDLLGLDGEYLNLIGEACKPTSFFMYGPGGSGKSTFTLKFAHYLAQKGNKVAYVASEQYQTPVLKKMLERLKLNDLPNFHIVKNLSVINISDYDVVVIDSKDSIDLTHDEFLKLQEKHSKTSFAILSQATKDGNFTGSEKWRNIVDTMIYCEDGIAQTGIDKNRWGGKSEIKIY